MREPGGHATLPIDLLHDDVSSRHVPRDSSGLGVDLRAQETSSVSGTAVSVSTLPLHFLFTFPLFGYLV